MRHFLASCLLLPTLLWADSAPTAGADAAAASAPVVSPFWRVSHADLPHSLHMIGTMHLARESDLELPSEVYAALEQADQVYFELDMSDSKALMQAGMGLGLAGRLPAGTSLKDKVTPEVYEQTIKYAETYALPLSVIRSSRPWLVAVLIQLREAERVGLSTAYGIDNHLAKKAAALQKPIAGLEAPSAQVDMMANLSEEDQALFLFATLDEITNKPGWMLTLANAWRAGDTSLITPYLHDMRRDVPAVYANILADRNAEWMKVLLDEAPKKKLFVAVGLMHMLGPDGLIKGFEDAGFVVEQYALDPATLAR